MSIHGGATIHAKSFEPLATTAGAPGSAYTYRLPRRGWQAELYIDGGRQYKDWKKRVFAWLEEQRGDIDNKFGPGLQWEPRDQLQSARVIVAGSGDWRSPRDEWPDAQDKMIDAMKRLKDVFDPYVREAARLDAHQPAQIEVGVK